MSTFKEKIIRWPDKTAIKFKSTFLVQNQAQRKSWMICSADFSLWTSHKTHLTDNADEVLFLQNVEVSIEGKPIHSSEWECPIQNLLAFSFFFLFFVLGSGCHFGDPSCETVALLPHWHTAGVNCQLFPLHSWGDLSALTEVHGTSSDLAGVLESRI